MLLSTAWLPTWEDNYLIFNLRNLKLPAIDLSPVGNTCGGPTDGILSVDLLDEIGVTIDFKCQLLESNPSDPKIVNANMENSMQSCVTAFNEGQAAEFEECLEPDTVVYTPDGEFVGRKKVLEYLRERISSTPRTSATKSRYTRYRPTATLSGIPTIIPSTRRKNI
jgi:uncharacterized protein DUF4440